MFYIFTWSTFFIFFTFTCSTSFSHVYIIHIFANIPSSPIPHLLIFCHLHIFYIFTDIFFISVHLHIFYIFSFFEPYIFWHLQIFSIFSTFSSWDILHLIISIHLHLRFVSMCFSDGSVVPMRHGTPSHKTNARLSDRGIKPARMTERSLFLSLSLTLCPSLNPKLWNMWRRCTICRIWTDVEYVKMNIDVKMWNMWRCKICTDAKNEKI